MKKLQKENKDIEIDVQVMSQWGNINDIPKDQKHLKCFSPNFSSKFITNKQVFEQIEYIYIKIENETKTQELDFSSFKNCKKFIFDGCLGDNDGQGKWLMYPPNVEEVILNVFCKGDDEYNNHNMDYLKHLKRITTNAEVNIPKKHYEYIELRGEDECMRGMIGFEEEMGHGKDDAEYFGIEETTIDDISCDKLVKWENGEKKVTINWNEDMKEELEEYDEEMKETFFILG